MFFTVVDFGWNVDFILVGRADSFMVVRVACIGVGLLLGMCFALHTGSGNRNFLVFVKFLHVVHPPSFPPRSRKPCAVYSEDSVLVRALRTHLFRVLLVLSALFYIPFALFV